MGYVSHADALRMKRADLADRFVETQTMAASAISVALELGGVEAERRIMARFEERLERERAAGA